MNPGPTLLRIDARAILDARRVALAPGSMLLQVDPAARPAARPAAQVLAVGSPAEIDAHPAASRARRLARPGHILIPGLVNAHTHLDLTHLGPRPHDPASGFVSWVDMIRAGRHTTEEGIRQAVEQGVRQSLRGGTVAVGDIAGAPAGQMTDIPWSARTAAGLPGVTYLEFFGIGRSLEPRRRALESWLSHPALTPPASADPWAGLGLQPHAPNTVDRRLYRWTMDLARERGVRVSTHLAETAEERTFVAQATGPQRELLERVGVWEDSVLDEVGRGLHPVAHLREILNAGPMLVAHVNDADDAAIETLAAAGASVAFCPRASAYFNAAAHFGPHRFRDMLGAGVNVCLGTDSIVNLPEGDVAARGMSMVDEMAAVVRLGADPRQALAMATHHGARALGLPEHWVGFVQEREVLGVVAVDAAERPEADAGQLLGGVLGNLGSRQVELLVGPTGCAI